MRAYRCTPPIERFLLDRFSEQWDSFSPFIAKITVDGHFILNEPTWWELRRNTFVTVYKLRLVQFEIEGIPLDFYLADQAWMGQLQTAFNDGIISKADPMCYQVDFINAP